MPKHIAVWIDHKEARVYHVRPDGRLAAYAKQYFHPKD